MNVTHLLGLLLSQFSLLLDLFLLVNRNVWVSLSVKVSLLSGMLLTAHLMVRPPSFVQLWGKKQTKKQIIWSHNCYIRYKSITLIRREANVAKKTCKIKKNITTN